WPRCCRASTPAKSFSTRNCRRASDECVARPFQLGTKAGIADRDQSASALAERAPAQVGDAVFGDHTIRLGARRCDHSVSQLGDDARTSTIPLRRLQRDNGSSLRCPVGSANKVHLPTDGADMPPSRRFGIYLAGQVDFERTVDRDEAAELAENQRVMRI